MFVTSWDHDRCLHLMPNNEDANKLVRFWTLHSASLISSCCHWFDGHHSPLLVKRLSRKHSQIKALYYHEPYDSGTKRYGALALSKNKKKFKERAFRAGTQQLFNKLFNNKLTRYQSSYQAMSPEGFEQLLDAGPKCSSFCFLSVFWQIRCSEPFCTTVVYIAFDNEDFSCNVFWKVCIRESEIDCNRTNHNIESFIRLKTDS